MVSTSLLAPANFTTCRQWRYTLCRPISMYGTRPLVVCGYNPSVANETALDPTCRREVDYAQQWGCDIYLKVNLFAAVGTDPDTLATFSDPIGPENDRYIREAIAFSKDSNGILLAAWGVPKGKQITRAMAIERAKVVAEMGEWNTLKVTKDGHPQHPLYLAKNLKPTPWSAPE